MLGCSLCEKKDIAEEYAVLVLWPHLMKVSNRISEEPLGSCGRAKGELNTVLKMYYEINACVLGDTRSKKDEVFGEAFLVFVCLVCAELRRQGVDQN